MGNARTYHGCTQLAILAMGLGALPAVDGECGCLHDLLLRTDGEAALDLLPVTVAGPHAGCAMQRTRCTHARHVHVHAMSMHAHAEVGAPRPRP